jgi:hypothetical protein
VADIFLPVQCTPENRAAQCPKETSCDGDTGLVSIAGQQGGEDSGYANGDYARRDKLEAQFGKQG